MLLLPLALAQDVSIHESLAVTTSADSVSGGTFTGAGWRIDDSNSKLYWDLGAQLAEGDLSITIDDISWDNLVGANNHLIELFSDGGHSSDNRAINLRLYGGGDGDPYGEWGDLKLLGWDRTTNPGGEHLVAEQRYYGLDWDGLPHTWRITWNATDFVLYRDGTELIRMDVTGIDLRVRYLWIPLQDWGGDYSAPVGALYSDLALDGWEPTDDGGGVDTGVPDDGDPTTFSPAEDVTAASWEPSQSYSVPDDLCVELDASYGYLLYDLSALEGTVTSAVLALHARDVSEATGDGGTVYAVSDTSWTEDSLTWNNRPSFGAAVASFPAVQSGDDIEIDVTSAVSAGGRVAFALATTGDNSAHFSSKEDGDGSHAPLLRVTVETSSGGDDGDTDDADDTDTTGDGGDENARPADTGDLEGSGPVGGEPGEATAMSSGGCACDAGAAGAGWLASSIVLAVTGARRRSGRR